MDLIVRPGNKIWLLSSRNRNLVKEVCSQCGHERWKSEAIVLVNFATIRSVTLHRDSLPTYSIGRRTLYEDDYGEMWFSDEESARAAANTKLEVWGAKRIEVERFFEPPF